MQHWVSDQDASITTAPQQVMHLPGLELSTRFVLHKVLPHELDYSHAVICHLSKNKISSTPRYHRLVLSKKYIRCNCHKAVTRSTPAWRSTRASNWDICDCTALITCAAGNFDARHTPRLDRNAQIMHRRDNSSTTTTSFVHQQQQIFKL